MSVTDLHLELRNAILIPSQGSGLAGGGHGIQQIVQPLIRRLKIINVIGVLRQIADLRIDTVCDKGLTVILGDKRGPLKGCGIDPEQFLSQFLRKIVTGQMGRKICQLKFILRRFIAESSADRILFPIAFKL